MTKQVEGYGVLGADGILNAFASFEENGFASVIAATLENVDDPNYSENLAKSTKEFHQQLLDAGYTFPRVMITVIDDTNV